MSYTVDNLPVYERQGSSRTSYYQGIPTSVPLQSDDPSWSPSSRPSMTVTGVAEGKMANQQQGIKLRDSKGSRPNRLSSSPTSASPISLGELPKSSGIDYKSIDLEDIARSLRQSQQEQVGVIQQVQLGVILTYYILLMDGLLYESWLKCE